MKVRSLHEYVYPVYDLDHELNAGIVILILHVSIPAQSSVKAKTKGETVVGILIAHVGKSLVIVGF